MPNAPPDAAVERFRETLTHGLGLRDDCRIGVAVSGGADSLALLVLVHAAMPQVEAATVDHGLRHEAAAEANHVAEICTSLGVPHSTLVLGRRDKGNVSDWARRARYDALEEWRVHRGLDVLMTAHHADDQLETIIMRLNRGSGVSGLAGIRARNGVILRPLLGWRKSELEDLVDACGIVAMDDPTNRDDRFDRARLRKALATADWLDPEAAARSAHALAQAEEALDWTARAYEGRRVAEKDGIISLAPDGLPHEFLRRLVLIALRRIAPDGAPRGDELERLITGLKQGRTATLAGVKCTGGTFWLFSHAPPRRKN